jgi:carbamate kinase
MRNDWKVSSVMWALEEVCDRIMEIYIMRGVVIYSPHQSHSCDQNNESEMKSSCGTCVCAGGGGVVVVKTCRVLVE